MKRGKGAPSLPFRNRSILHYANKNHRSEQQGNNQQGDSNQTHQKENDQTNSDQESNQEYSSQSEDSQIENKQIENEQEEYHQNDSSETEASQNNLQNNHTPEPDLAFLPDSQGSSDEDEPTKVLGEKDLRKLKKDVPPFDPQSDEEPPRLYLAPNIYLTRKTEYVISNRNRKTLESKDAIGYVEPKSRDGKHSDYQCTVLLYYEGSFYQCGKTKRANGLSDWIADHIHEFAIEKHKQATLDPRYMIKPRKKPIEVAVDKIVKDVALSCGLR